MYFDYSGVNNFYELLYYIPFTELFYGSKYKIKGYSYEYNEEEIFLDLNTTKGNDIIGDVSPPLNFYHLNLPPMNKKYREIDLFSNETTPLILREKMKYVYDDELAMCCESYFYKEINQCTDKCVDYHRIPYVGVNEKSSFCDLRLYLSGFNELFKR